MRSTLSLETVNPLAERIEQLKALFPEVVQEGQIDIATLQALLGRADSTPERYTFSWAGKQDALLTLQKPCPFTLKPVPEESVNFETTNHIFIEGENLEVLKLLYKSYFGRIKMIYIDPPYNTGNNEFIYPDDFEDPLNNYLRQTGQVDENGNAQSSRLEINGKKHSRWLSMMYPRLFLARQLLKEDGVIFISIDEHEVHNLRLLMDQIFGEENFIAEYVWRARSGQSGTTQQVSFQHEYILCYTRNSTTELSKMRKIKEGGAYEDELGKYSLEQLRQWGQGDRREDRETMYFPIKMEDGTQIYPIREDGSEGRWRFGHKAVQKMLDSGNLVFSNDGTKWQVYRKIREGRITYSAYGTILDRVGTTADGTKIFQSLLNTKIPNFFPKPVTLIQFLIELATEDNGDENIILDFFSGSCTTAHAILEMNHQAQSNLRFIMVQFPEAVNHQDYKTIADIGKERIRRVIQRLSEQPNGQQLKMDTRLRETPADLGFRVFRLEQAFRRQWPELFQDETTPEEYLRQLQLMVAEPLVRQWDEADLITEIALKELGYGLNFRIERAEQVETQTVWKVMDEDKQQYFYICLDDTITHYNNFDPLRLQKDDLLVCRDHALTDEIVMNLGFRSRIELI